MAIVTTAKARTVRLVYSGDSSVKLKPDAHAARTAVARDKLLRAAEAELPDTATEDERKEALAAAATKAAALTVPLAWVNLDECDTSTGATVATIRALSWLEDQEARDLPAAQQIVRTVQLGLVELDGAAAGAEAFKADPAAKLMTPLYHAIAELTWGN